MLNKSRFAMTTVTVLMVFVFSAMWTAPVLADDSAPPEDTPTETTPPADTATETAPPQEDNTQIVPTEDEQPAAADAAPEETSIVEILAAIPDDTQLVILDENGNALPLASQEAQEAILFKDPIWCPVGVAPKSGVGGCSISYPNLSTLVASFVPTTSGTIWIEAGNDSGTEVVIDGATNWASAANFNLTLQGGWVGCNPTCTGSTAITGVSVFDTAISIVNWNGVVTIKDITLIGAQNTVYNGTGALYVKTKKNIVLSNVTVVNTNYSFTDGAYLDNSDSPTQATVTVRNSSFNNNTSWGGLTIFSKGAVALINVNANNNRRYGASIRNDFDSIPSPVTVANSSFNGSTEGDGLEIYSNGAVRLNQVTAGNNSVDGVFVDNADAPTLNPQPVTVTGFLSAFNNGGSGLYILSKGVVSLANLTANANSYGTYIDNAFGTLPRAVILSGTNTFNNNTHHGLYIASRGAIILSNITAIWNGIPSDFDGVFIRNDIHPATPQNITLTGYNYFLHNGNHGLLIVSYGAITLNNVTAIDNGNAVNDNIGSGVVLNNSGGTLVRPITLNGTNFFSDNDAAGLEAYSSGVITTSNVTATGNGPNGGVYLENSFGTSAGVVLKGTNYFNRNAGNGLTVFSRGAITLNNVTASYNQDNGVFLHNLYGTLQKPVFVNGYGLFEWNVNDGLFIQSNGAITTRNLTASYNDGNGVSLWTKGITAPQLVTLNGTNNFNFNGNSGGESGLVVNADGTIRVSNITANYNFSNGAYLNNYTNWSNGTFPTFGSVILSGFGKFTANNWQGLFVYTHGAVTLNYVASNFNGGDGIGIAADGNVTLVCSSANNNTWGGLYMYAGPVPVLTLRGFYAIGNTFTNEALNYVTLIRTRCP